MFDLFCGVVLPWDKARGCFASAPKPYEVSPAGMPAFIERRVRPAGFLKTRDQRDALHEPRADKDGKSYDLCYTAECPTTLVYVDPTKERFKGLTLEEVQRLYDTTAGVLPMYVEGLEALSLPGDPLARQPVKTCRAYLALGRDVASLGTDDSRAAALAAVAEMGLGPDDRLHAYAVTANGVVLVSRALTADELRLAASRIRDMFDESLLEPGADLNLHFDLPHATPRGKVLRRRR
jgi:hypothetical protein